MTTTPDDIDAQIARLQAKKEQVANDRAAANAAYDAANEALEDVLQRTAEDVQALRELDGAVLAYKTACRDFHRVTTGQTLRRKRTNLAVAGPVADLNDTALD